MSEPKYIVRKTWKHNSRNHSHNKMFDTLKNATDYMLELKDEGYKPKIYLANEIEVEYNVTVVDKTKEESFQDLLNDIEET